MAIFQLSDRIIKPAEKKYGYAEGKDIPFQMGQMNPLLWLDAADADSFTLSGSSVSQWNDKSGNDRHATPTIYNPPQKDGESVVFAENNGLVLTSGLSFSSLSFFIVLFTVDTSYVMFLGGSAYGTVGQSSSGIAISSGFGNPAYRHNGEPVSWANRGQVYTALNNKLSLLSIVGAATNTWSQFILAYYGAGYSFAGKYYEFIAIEGIPNEDDMNEIENHLMKKWSIV